ncbi:hypothetical protein KR032_005184 [Drosophila birchii]|nr:hypothetical protein KR032_005184 [Drosophila birchii]
MDQQPQATPPSKKRRHSEYHDPDYQTEQPGQRQQNEPVADEQSKRLRVEQETQAHVAKPPSADTMRRICELVRQEFQREITQKVEQLTEIDRRLLQARQLLDKLRYQVVSEYYQKQQVPLTTADVAKVRGDSLFADEGSLPQLPLHPAVKKIVGKRPIPIQNHLPERTAATLAKQTIRLRNPAHRRAERRRQQKIRDQGIVTDHSKVTPEEQKPEAAPVAVKLEDEQPCTSRQAYERQLELNASRLNNKNKFNFVVGNTSKYIGEGLRESSREGQAMIYKWLVYVQGKDLPQPLNTYIKKVRFQLHHSYRPNDIVDVHSPPFQLSRHGWGEFPMRIQLFFQEALQEKPVQLMHTVILDKSRSGLHTMGAETTVEIWLKAEQALRNREADKPTPTFHLPPALPAIPGPPPSLDSCKPRTISITQNKEELDDNLFAGINKIELSDDIEQIEPTVLVSEPLKLSYSPRKQQPPTPPRPQLRLNAAPVSASRPSVVYLPVNGRAQKQESWQEQEHRPEDSPQKRWPESPSDRPPIKPVRNGHHQRKKNMVFQKAGKLYIIDPQQRKLKQSANQQSLLKPQLSLLKAPTAMRWHLLQCIQHDHGYANMSTNDVDEKPIFLHSVTAPITTTSLQTGPRRLQQSFVGVHFWSMRSAVEFLLRRMPLTRFNQKAEEEYSFTCSTLESFQGLTALKQRCFEYMRARLLRRYLTQHLKLQKLDTSGREHYWSLREIVGFARIHGYTPPLKMLTSSGETQQTQKPGVVEQLAHRVQEQLKEKPQPQLSAYCSLSAGNRLNAWMDRQSILLKGHDQKMLDQEFIDVLGVDRLYGESNSKRNDSRSRLRQEVNSRTLLCLPPPDHLDSETQLVQVMCKDINITLEPEEPLPGVSQPVTLTLLAHVLRTFVDRLVRRSVALKLQQDTMDQLPTPAANTTLSLLPHDIGRAIGQCPELDFLGNTHLGVEPLEEPQT